MLLDSSKRIDPALRNDVDDIERRAYGYQVIGAQRFAAPWLRFAVTYEVTEPRRLNILEEFVLRAATEFQPEIDEQELADLLRVDRRFVSHTTTQLRHVGALEANSTSLIATKDGKRFVEMGKLPQSPAVKKLMVYLPPPPLNTFCSLPFTFSAETPRNARLQDLPSLPGVGKVDNPEQLSSRIDRESLIEVSNWLGQPLHDPEAGRRLSRILNVDYVDAEAQAEWHVFVIRDILEGDQNLVLRFALAEPFKMKPFELKGEELASFLDAAGSLQSFVGEDPEADKMMAYLPPTQGLTDHESRAVVVEALVEEETRKLRYPQMYPQTASQHDKGTATLIRDAEMRPTFVNTIKAAKRRLLIVSPWMTAEAVDEEIISIFRALAKKRVITLLGWGIAKAKSDDKQPASQLLKKLHSIQTPDSMPAVVPLWLGNQHSKDVLVDDHTHLCGSHNWLSYRGDWMPRGESVYKVTIPEQVKTAATCIEKLFTQSAENEWQSHLVSSPKHYDLQHLARCLMALVACRRAEQATHLAASLAFSPSGTAVPLADLLRAASERLYGIDPDVRLGMLRLVAESWSSLGAADRKQTLLNGGHALRENIKRLLYRVAEQRPEEVDTLIHDSVDFWAAVDVTLDQP